MKNFIIIVVIIVALVLGYQMISKNRPAEIVKLPSDTEMTQQTTPTTAEEQLPIEETNMIKQTMVEYTDAGFVPNTVTVPVGTTVTFTNNTENSMWVASDPHPAHTDFSAFDQKEGVKKEDGYSFAFTQKGTWSYHNHLMPKNKGMVVVE